MFDKTAMDQLTQVLRRSIDQNETAGGSLLIIKEGKEIFYHEDGFSDREAGLPFARDTIFRIFSMSKPVTAAAVMILMERGKFDLFEPVSKYLDGFKNQMVEDKGCLVPVKRDMTLKDLLSMTSGLVYGIEFGGETRAGKETEALLKEIAGSQSGNSPIGTVEAMNRMGKCTLASQPGSLWEYNPSADVLGAIVEIVSGKRFGEFLREEIFDPLNMQDTGFWVPKEKKNRLAKAYACDGNGGLKLYTDNCVFTAPAYESGGGGLVSTMNDYARFARMLLGGGNLDNIRILRPKTAKYMTSATITDVQQKNLWYTLDGYSYGNLLRVMTDCSKAGVIGSSGEYGWSGWMGTYFCNCPNDDLTFLFMMQKADSGTTHLARKLHNIVLSSCCE